jgi:putative ABC transport system ATP-binding protein
MPEAAMLELIDVHKTFHPGAPNEVRALKGVSLSLPEGGVAVIIGTNGSGKTSLQNAIAGSFLPDSGEIRIDGRDVTQWPEFRRAGMIGRVFQDPFKGTASGLSIAENMALASRRGQSRGLGPLLDTNLRRQIRDVVAPVNLGLEDRLDDAMGTLSGGQRQAVSLLMATWQKPRVLLLDEPTATLDPKSAQQLTEIGVGIIIRDHITTVMVTQSMQDAVTYGEQLIMMHRGRAFYQVAGEDKKRLRPADLLERFEEARRSG